MCNIWGHETDGVKCGYYPLVLCRLKEEIQQLQSRWDSNIKEMSHDAVTRDVELEAAHEEINRLKSDLAQRKDDLDRYTHFLAHFVCVCVCV